MRYLETDHFLTQCSEALEEGHSWPEEREYYAGWLGGNKIIDFPFIIASSRDGMHHIATTMCTFKYMVETRLDNLESKTTYTAPNLECHNQTQNPLPILANITSALYEQFNLSRESSISSDNTIDNPIEIHEADGQGKYCNYHIITAWCCRWAGVRVLTYYPSHLCA